MKMNVADTSLVPLPPGMTPLRWQAEAMLAIRRYLPEHGKVLVSAATGCHARGQMLMRYDGSLVAVEDVVVGDQLMGPDSTPRTVLSLARGRDQMFRIIPVKGEPWIVNGDHVLSLVDTRDKDDDRLVDVTVREWLAWGPNARHLHKLVRRAVTYPATPDATRPIPAYHLGLLVGDGGLSGGTLTLTSADPECRSACEELAAHFALVVHEYASGGGTPQFRLVKPGGTGGAGQSKANPLVAALAHLGLRCKGEHRRIPTPYLLGPRQDRLDLLAGLIDSDGHLTCGGYDWIAKGRGLAGDVTRLARSLGFAAYMKAAEKWSQFGGGRYWRVSVSGDMSVLPTRVPRKRAAERKQIKSVLRTGFRVEALDDGDYFGFALDGDCRYLLDDFTVTHNTGKGTLIAALVVKAARAGKRVLFLVHMDELIDDVMQRAIAAEPALPAGKVKARVNEIDRPAVFASVQTLRGKRLDSLDKFPFDFVVTDEAHHAAARSYKAIYSRVEKVNPRWRHILLTATPFRNAGGGKTSGLGDVVQHLVYEYSLADAITEGALCPLRGIRVETEIDLTGVDPDDEDALAKVVDTPDRNIVAARKYVEHCVAGGERREYTVSEKRWKDGDKEQPPATVEVTREEITGGSRLQAIAFCATIEHARNVAMELCLWGIRAEAVWGLDKERKRKIGQFKSGQIDVLCNNNLLSEGFDHKPTGAVLLLRPTQSRGLYAQQVGRVTRVSPGKREGLVIDFVANSDTHDLVSLADLSRPDATGPRVNEGDEVRHRRDAAKSRGLVESVDGYVDPDEQGVAMVLWRHPGRDDLGIVPVEPVEEKAADLVLVKRAPGKTDDEVKIEPSVIGVNEFAISLFGRGGGKRAGWYKYTDSRRRVSMVARGKQRGQSAVVWQARGGGWEAWSRDGDGVRIVASGEFAECERAAAATIGELEDYAATWLREPATEKQLATLAKFRVARPNLSRGEASMIIELRVVGMLVARQRGDYRPAARSDNRDPGLDHDFNAGPEQSP